MTTAELDVWLSAHRNELLFSGVPCEELAACFTWENLREVREEDTKGLELEGISGYAMKLLAEPGEELIRFSANEGHIPFGVLQWLVVSNADQMRPWQDLPQKIRSEINRPIRSSWPALIPLFLEERKPLSWKYTLLPPPPG